MMSIAADALLIGALGVAVCTDLRARRISNRLTYPLMLAGLVAQALAGGLDGLSLGALGWLAGGALLLLPWFAGAMGAGDVKLMAAVGALKGPQFVLQAAIFTGLAGGVVALICLLHLYGWRGTLGYFRRPRGAGVPQATIPYAPAIAAGVLLALIQSARLGG